MGAVVRLEDTRRRKNGEVKQFTKKKEVKLTKSGEIKKTPNNTKLNRDNVYPFKEEDIPKMVKQFKLRVDNAKNHEDEMIARRYLSMYIMGINIGLRISDLVTLKWSDIYNSDWTFRTGKSITPKKTRKSDRPNSNNEKPKQDKHILLKFNNDFKNAIEFYRQYCGEIKNMDTYIFTSRVREYIDGDTVGEVIKQVAKEVGIKYNVRTHSMRKTFCRLRYDHAEDKSEVLVELMVLLGHSSISSTKHYICISEEELEELYNSVSIGFDAIFE